MRQQASCTQRCTESKGNIETCQNTMKTGVPFKKLWNPYTISIQGMVSPLLTCALLVQVGILWYHTPTQLRMYTLNHRHTYTALYIRTHTRTEGCVWRYTNIRACTPVHGSRTSSMRCDTRSRRRACQCFLCIHPVWHSKQLYSSNPLLTFYSLRELLRYPRETHSSWSEITLHWTNGSVWINQMFRPNLRP